MSLSLDGNFLLNEGKVVIGCDIVDNPLEAFYGDVLGHMGLVQNFN